MTVRIKTGGSLKSYKGGKVGVPALQPMKMPKVKAVKPKKAKFGYV